MGLHGAWVVLAASAGVTVGNLLAAFLRWRHDRRVRELFRRRLWGAGPDDKA